MFWKILTQWSEIFKVYRDRNDLLMQKLLVSVQWNKFENRSEFGQVVIKNYGLIFLTTL